MRGSSRRGITILASAVIVAGALGSVPASSASSPAPGDLPPLADVPLYRVNVTANGIDPGPGPSGKPELAWRVDVGDMHMMPILVDGLLIAGTNDGRLVALDARSGETTWDQPVGDGPIQPAIASMDGLVFASDGSALHALETVDGTERWSRPVDVPAGPRLDTVDRIVYVGTTGGVVGYDPLSGDEVWRWEDGPPDVAVTPGPFADGVGYFAGGDGRVYAVDTRTGKVQWAVQTISNTIASGQVVGDTFYVSTNQGDAPEPVGEIYAVDRASGEVRWRFRAPSGQQLKEGPFKDGVLYANGTDDGIWALRDDGSSVTVLWHVDAPASHWPMALVDDTLYVAGLDGSVGAYATADGTLLWQTAPEGDIAVGPIVSGGMVFVNNDRTGVMAFADPSLIARLPEPVLQAAPSPAVVASPIAANPFTVLRTLSMEDTGIAIPLEMAAGPDGLLYVLDTTPQVTVIDPADGHVVRRWGHQGAGPGEFDVRRYDGNGGWGNIAVTPDGGVYVADGSNHRIQVFEPDGTFLFQFGSFGTGPGQFGWVNELAIGPDGSVYAGQETGPISKFTPDGKFVWQTPNTEQVYGYVVRADGTLIGTCDLCGELGELVVLDPDDGHVLERWEEPAIDGDRWGPVELDPAGNIYLHVYASDSLMVFDPAGTFLGSTTLHNAGRQAAPSFMPDGHGFFLGSNGLLELKLTLPTG